MDRVGAASPLLSETLAVLVAAVRALPAVVLGLGVVAVPAEQAAVAAAELLQQVPPLVVVVSAVLAAAVVVAVPAALAAHRVPAATA